MTEIKIEKKKSLFLWILLILGIIAALFFLFFRNNEMRNENTDEKTEINDVDEKSTVLENTAVKTYIAFIEDSSTNMNLDHDYTSEAINKLADAVEEKADVEVDHSVIADGHEAYSTPANEGIEEFLNSDGENHLIIPVGVVTLDEKLSKVHCDNINYSMFANTKRLKKGDPIDRSYEQKLLAHHDQTITFDEEADSTNLFYERPQFLPRY